MTIQTYRLGNCLRGGFEGQFESVDEAWQKLGTRFLNAYPAEKMDENNNPVIDPNGSRSVIMKTEEKNQYGFEEFLKCKDGQVKMSEKVPINDNDYPFVNAMFI